MKRKDYLSNEPSGLQQAADDLFGGPPEVDGIDALRAVTKKRASGLALAEDGSPVAAGLTVTGRGLVIDRARVTDEGLAVFGAMIRRFKDDVLAWIVGDYANLCAFERGKTYAEIAEVTGYDEQTVQDYAYVSRSVEFSIRIEDFYFAHHRMVAPYADQPALQRYLLQYAYDRRLSGTEFARAIPYLLEGETPPTDNPIIPKEDRPTPPQSRKEGRDALKTLEAAWRGKVRLSREAVIDQVEALEMLCREIREAMGDRDG